MGLRQRPRREPTAEGSAPRPSDPRAGRRGHAHGTTGRGRPLASRGPLRHSPSSWACCRRPGHPSRQPRQQALAGEPLGRRRDRGLRRPPAPRTSRVAANDLSRSAPTPPNTCSSPRRVLPASFSMSRSKRPTARQDTRRAADIRRLRNHGDRERRKRAQRCELTAWITEQLVDIDRHAPVPFAEFGQKGIEPVRAASGFAEAPARREQSNVRLVGKILGRTVGRIVVDDEESAHTQIAIVFQECRQAQALVPALREGTNLS